jgi:hypothetical protein
MKYSTRPSEPAHGLKGSSQDNQERGTPYLVMFAITHSAGTKCTYAPGVQPDGKDGDDDVCTQRHILPVQDPSGEPADFSPPAPQSQKITVKPRDLIHCEPTPLD